MKVSSFARICALTLFATRGVFSQEEPDTLQDGTDVDIAAIEGRSYQLPNLQHAQIVNRADRADLADRALSADLAIEALFATNAGRALLAEVALNAETLANLPSTYFLDASNLNAGTISLDRLVGTLLEDGGRLREAVLGAIIDIDINGNAATANTTDFADRADTAAVCTGGAANCDYFTYRWVISRTTEGPCVNNTQAITHTIFCQRSDNTVGTNEQCTDNPPRTNFTRACVSSPAPAPNPAPIPSPEPEPEPNNPNPNPRPEPEPEPEPVDPPDAGSFDPEWVLTPFGPFSECRGAVGRQIKTRTRTQSCQRNGETVNSSVCAFIPQPLPLVEEEECGRAWYPAGRIKKNNRQAQGLENCPAGVSSGRTECNSSDPCILYSSPDHIPTPIYYLAVCK